MCLVFWVLDQVMYMQLYSVLTATCILQVGRSLGRTMSGPANGEVPPTLLTQSLSNRRTNSLCEPTTMPHHPNTILSHHQQNGTGEKLRKFGALKKIQRYSSNQMRGFKDHVLKSYHGWWAATVATYCPSRPLRT